MAQCLSNIKTCRACETENIDRRPVCSNCSADMRCTKDAVRGYTRCDSHGGPVPSRNFYGRGTMTTGSGSSFAITRLAAKYNEMRKNGQLLSNRRVVEIIDDRIVQLAGRIDLDEAPDRVAKLHTLWQEYTGTESDTEKIKIRVSLDAAFEAIYHDYKAWEQLFEAFDLRRKMAESEVKVLKEIKGIISYEDAYQLSAQMLAITMRAVGDDPKKLKQVQYEFARLIGEVSDNVTKGFIEPDGDSGAEGSSAA